MAGGQSRSGNIDAEDDLWFNLLDHVTVFSKKDVRFTFKNGTEISVK